jgi:glycosyltransferase involved in cell wall biosynthesis
MSYCIPIETIVDLGEAPRRASGDLVTVAVSLFNYRKYIKECLASIKAQTHAALEIVVVDDASSDDSAVVAEKWLRMHATRFDRALLLKHRRNEGLAAARNNAFACARGATVFVMDADNILYPRAVARLLEVFQQNRGVGAVYSQLEFFGAERRLGNADIWRRETFAAGNYVDAMALVATAAWRRVGGYNDMGGWEDYDLWCKFIENGLEALYVPEILCRYRVHSMSMIQSKPQDKYREMFVEMCLRHPWLAIGFGD